MWYSTVTETEQTIPPGEATGDQLSGSLVEQTAKIAGLKKVDKTPAPGSEYWLP